MKVLHVSAECYPAAKAGGLGDVVGALPKYLNNMEWPSAVIMPKYRTKWVRAQKIRPVFAGVYPLKGDLIPYSIEIAENTELGFPLYLVNIVGQFDRPGIYGDSDAGWYSDNGTRFIHFQLATLAWVKQMSSPPSLNHCHDYHSGLIPFLLKYGEGYESMRELPTVFTIHNGEYHGELPWKHADLLPKYPPTAKGLLDWNGLINPLASGIKCAWTLTTVSSTYLDELSQDANGLEVLFKQEKSKSIGVLNGIDDKVWDPGSDPLIKHHFTGNWPDFKRKNKEELLDQFYFDIRFPVVTFIGRLVREKGADILPDLIDRMLKSTNDINFLVLGTGEPHIHEGLLGRKHIYNRRFDVALEYNEQLAHQLYAGSDFLLMPSRVEPCGLNQMYAMRYGTVPIVRTVGGLKDTVIDVLESPTEGRGFRFDLFNLEEAQHALWRAREYAQQSQSFHELRERITHIDFSWDRAALHYISIYKHFQNPSLL
ncbi:MAG: glycogen synthase [Saprospiraceae bacterium]|nr:glycogen synthase [Saprospiraceae bacterium]